MEAALVDEGLPVDGVKNVLEIHLQEYSIGVASVTLHPLPRRAKADLRTKWLRDAYVKRPQEVARLIFYILLANFLERGFLVLCFLELVKPFLNSRFLVPLRVGGLKYVFLSLRFRAVRVRQRPAHVRRGGVGPLQRAEERFRVAASLLVDVGSFEGSLFIRRELVARAERDLCVLRVRVACCVRSRGNRHAIDAMLSL